MLRRDKDAREAEAHVPQQILELAKQWLDLARKQAQSELDWITLQRDTNIRTAERELAGVY